MNGPDPNVLDLVLDQLSDKDRKQPQDLDKAVIGMFGLRALFLTTLHSWVTVCVTIEAYGLFSKDKGTCKNIHLIWIHIYLTFIPDFRAHSSGEGKFIHDSSEAYSVCFSKHLRYPPKSYFHFFHSLELWSLCFTKHIKVIS